MTQERVALRISAALKIIAQGLTLEADGNVEAASLKTEKGLCDLALLAFELDAARGGLCEVLEESGLMPYISRGIVSRVALRVAK